MHEARDEGRGVRGKGQGKNEAKGEGKGKTSGARAGSFFACRVPLAPRPYSIDVIPHHLHILLQVLFTRDADKSIAFQNGFTDVGQIVNSLLSQDGAELAH